MENAVQQQDDQIFSSRSPSSRKRTEEIMTFMKGMSTFIDLEEALENLDINFDALSEEQLSFFITRSSFRNAPKAEIYDILSNLNTSDIMMLNLNTDNLTYFIIVIGSFFYARSVMRLVSRTEIVEIKELLGDQLYKHVVGFGKTDCKDDYPIKSPFVEQFQATGYRIFKLYFDAFPDIIQKIALTRTEYKKPEKDMSALRISDEYAREIIALVQSYLLGVV